MPTFVFSDKSMEQEKLEKWNYWLMVLFSVIVSCDYIVTWLWRICRLFRSVPWIEDVRSIVEPVGEQLRASLAFANISSWILILGFWIAWCKLCGKIKMNLPFGIALVGTFTMGFSFLMYQLVIRALLGMLICNFNYHIL